MGVLCVTPRSLGKTDLSNSLLLLLIVDCVEDGCSHNVKAFIPTTDKRLFCSVSSAFPQMPGGKR